MWGVGRGILLASSLRGCVVGSNLRQEYAERGQNHRTMYTGSPYVDTRAPLVDGRPEERRYRIAYLDDDVITTGWQDPLVVIAQG